MFRSCRSVGLVAVSVILSVVLAGGVAPALSGPKDSESPFTHFGKLTKDTESFTGFFDLYKKRDHVYLEIPLDRLDEPFLLVQSLSRGIGANGILGGMPTDIFDGQIVKFERHGDRIHLVHVNHRFTAPEGSPEAAAVELSYGNSVLASLKIESERYEGDEVGVAPEPEKDKEENKEDGEDEDTSKDEEGSDDPDTGDDGVVDTDDEDSAGSDSADTKENAKEDGEDPKESEEPEEPKVTVSVVVDFASVLISDLPNLSQGMNKMFKSSYSLDGDRSVLKSIKVFPKNAEFEMDLTFTTKKDPFIESVIDSRYVTIGLHQSFSALPTEPMKPRLADPRMGYFLSVHKDFSLDHEKEFFVRYINRWRLEKQNPNAALSKPVKPIVYYIENTVPKEYRGYIKQGVELWQKAFEKAGFKDAILAKDQPDDPDWSAEDVRYSTIRWITSHKQSFGAIGPSRVDPRTGEILDADILVEAGMIQGFRNAWQRFASPPGGPTGGAEEMDPFEYALEADRIAFEKAWKEHGPEAATRLCAAGQCLAMGGSFTQIALAARGDIRPGDDVPDEYLGQALVWVTAHEVGHTLGLRHNFKSSMAVPYEKLHEKAYVRTHGLYGSVMEYPVPNVAQDIKDQGYYYTPVVGTYDDWVIRYGYTEYKRTKTPADDLKYLAEIAGESSNPLHYYGPDEDSYLPGSVDAFTNTYDLGGDPIAFARDRSAHIRSLFDGLEDRMVASGESWSNLTNGMNTLFFYYYRSMSFLSRQVAGMSTNRAHRGESEKGPMVMLSGDRQREAVQILADNMFNQNPFQLPSGSFEKLEPNRWTHWGVNFMPGGRADYPLHSRVLAMQRPIIGRLTHPITLARLVDAELYGNNPFTVVELFDTVGDAVWSEVANSGGMGSEGVQIPTIRRGVQRLWLDRLIEVAFIPQTGTPADARAVARMNLDDLSGAIGNTLHAGNVTDGYTKAHLLDCQARIETAMASGYELEVLKGR